MVVVTLALGCAEPARHRPDSPFGSEFVGVNAPAAGQMGGQFGDEGDPRPHEYAGRVVIWPGAAALAGGDIGVDRAAVFLEGDTELLVGRFGALLTAADLDGDGVLELLVGGDDSSGSSFRGSQHLFPGDRLLDPTLTATDGTVALVAGGLLRAIPDLDGDGAPEVGTPPLGYYTDPGVFDFTTVLHRMFRGADLTSGSAVTAAESWLAIRIEPGGTYANHPPLPLGDLDGDGLTEIALDRERHDGSGWDVRVLGGADLTGGGEVAVGADALTIDLGPMSVEQMIAVGDLDGDGLEEMAIGSWDPDQVVLFAGGDLAPGHVPGPPNPLATIRSDIFIEVAPMSDLDGDGHPELGVSSDASLGWISGARLRDGAVIAESDLDRGLVHLTTSQHQNADLNYDLGRDAMVDLDGDGLLDWLVPGEAGVCVVRGVDLADPSWAGEPYAVLTADSPATIVVPLSDVDGDGLPELAVGFPSWDP